MIDMSDIKLAEQQMNEAMRANNLKAATEAWDHLTNLRNEYAEEHQLHLTK